MEDEASSDLERYVLLSKDDHNAMNQPDDDQWNGRDPCEVLLAGQLQDSSADQAQFVHRPVEPEDGQPRSGEENQNQAQKMYREQDLYLPITNISRIMKKSLPDNYAKLSKDAKTTMQECVSEFISFVASEACETVRSEKRQTLNGDDLIAALEKLGFQTAQSNYIEPLKLYLAKYRQATTASSPGSNGPSDSPAGESTAKQPQTD